MADELIPVFEEELEVDLTEHNETDGWELPIPATYVVRPDGGVEDAFIHADYTKRMEPEDILAALDQIDGS